jgi:hypothetical protein
VDLDDAVLGVAEMQDGGASAILDGHVDDREEGEHAERRDLRQPQLLTAIEGNERENAVALYCWCQLCVLGHS